MSEQTEKAPMKTGDDPKDFGVAEVNAYLASEDTSPEERQRVLDAEHAEGGKKRTTVAAATPEPEKPTEGLASTGNPNDLSTKPDAEVSANIGHQEGAPEALTKLADETAELGYFGESAEKPDYSQANAEVMNGGGKS